MIVIAEVHCYDPVHAEPCLWDRFIFCSLKIYIKSIYCRFSWNLAAHKWRARASASGALVLDSELNDVLRCRVELPLLVDKPSKLVHREKYLVFILLSLDRLLTSTRRGPVAKQPILIASEPRISTCGRIPKRIASKIVSWLRTRHCPNTTLKTYDSRD